MRTCLVLAALSVLSTVVVHGFDKIEVHLVPHSHDDVGWLKTYQQYANGWNNSIQNSNVHLIYDSVIAELQLSPHRRFTAVEMAFFAPWYEMQSEDIKQSVRDLVAAGQLQFAGGGWVMHDEATTTWFDMLDQMTLGHDFIATVFNTTAQPTVMWQIDPFGHSATSASLFSQSAGIAATFHSRVPFADFADMQRQQSREHLWRPSPAAGPAATVWASQMTHSTYCPPEWLNFDVLVSPSGLGSNNALDAAFVEKLEAMIRSDVAVTRGRTVMIPMGCDFAYQQARTWFAAMDFLTARLSNASEGRFVFRYSTPAEYLEAKAAETVASASLETNEHDEQLAVAESTLAWPLRTKDMLPYDDGPTAVWSGFFSSRSALKRLIRRASALCRFARSASALAAFRDVHVVSEHHAHLRHCRETVAIAQHHDAVTGTAKQHVTFDYAAQLHAGALSAAKVVFQIHGVANNGSDATGAVDPCLTAWNQSTCEAAERWLASAPSTSSDANQSTAPNLARDLIVIAGNTLSRNRTLVITVPFRVPIATAPVTAVGGRVREIAVVPALLSPTHSQPCEAYASENGDESPRRQCFPYSMLVTVDVPAFSSTVLRLGGTGSSATAPTTPPPPPAPPSRRRMGSGAQQVITIGSVTLTFSPDGRKLLSMQRGNLSAPLSLEWCAYAASAGSKQRPQASGAYVFRVASTECLPLSSLITADSTQSYPKAFEVLLLTEEHAIVEQRVAPFLTQRLTVGRGVEGDASVSYWMDAVPIAGLQETFPNGAEVVARWVLATDSSSAPLSWEVDANGRELITRRSLVVARDDARSVDAFGSCFYPMNAVALVASPASVDGAVRLAFYSDVPVAAAVLAHQRANISSFEMLIQRRLLLDDGRGVGEPLNETEHVQDYTTCVQRLWRGPACGSRNGGGIRLQGSFGASVVAGVTAQSATLSDVTRWREHADAWLSPVVPLYRAVASVTSPSALTVMNGAAVAEAVRLGSGASITTLDASVVEGGSIKVRARFSNDADATAVQSLPPVNISLAAFTAALLSGGGSLSAQQLAASSSSVNLMSLTFNQPAEAARLRASSVLNRLLDAGAFATSVQVTQPQNDVVTLHTPKATAAVELHFNGLAP